LYNLHMGIFIYVIQSLCLTQIKLFKIILEFLRMCYGFEVSSI
jgi:hypothetical protein